MDIRYEREDYVDVNDSFSEEELEYLREGILILRERYRELDRNDRIERTKLRLRIRLFEKILDANKPQTFTLTPW